MQKSKIFSRCAPVAYTDWLKMIKYFFFKSHSFVAEEMGKPGSDAGMPGIEDSEVGKMDEVQFGKH